MLFKGTTSRSAEDIARSVDSIGGNLDAFTGQGTGLLQHEGRSTSICRIAFDVLADLVLNPLFRDEDIEKEKGVILEEIKMEADNPDVPGPRDLLVEFLEGSSARQADSGNPEDGEALRSAT